MLFLNSAPAANCEKLPSSKEGAAPPIIQKTLTKAELPGDCDFVTKAERDDKITSVKLAKGCAAASGCSVPGMASDNSHVRHWFLLFTTAKGARFKTELVPDMWTWSPGGLIEDCRGDNQDWTVFPAQLSGFYRYAIICEWTNVSGSDDGVAVTGDWPIHKFTSLVHDFRSGHTGYYNMWESMFGANCQTYAGYVYKKLTGKYVQTEADDQGPWFFFLGAPILSCCCCMLCTICCALKIGCECFAYCCTMLDPRSNVEAALYCPA